LYADDVILLAPSVQALQSLVDICASELELHSDPFFSNVFDRSSKQTFTVEPPATKYTALFHHKMVAKTE